MGILRCVLLVGTAIVRCTAIEMPTNDRHLSYETIAYYEPRTLVTDYAAMDLDQLEIEGQLHSRKLDSAKSIYELGGHTQSIARLNLKNATPPDAPFRVDTIVMGWNNNGDSVQGKLVQEGTWSANDETVSLLVRYDISPIQKNYSSCQVGGLVKISAANKGGCFADSGQIQILDLRKNAPTYLYDYSYDIRHDNFNGLTIQSLSTHAERDMFHCHNCPYQDYNKFVQYYNDFKYGDKWIQSAIEGSPTDFLRGNVDFTGYERPDRAAAIKIATKFMNIWMYVIRLMENALDVCEEDCGKRCNVEPITSWDQAVALFVGSLEGSDGAGDGILLYDLADRMCTLFRSCGEDASEETGTSFVNLEILREFELGQHNILRQKCTEARFAKERIVNLMAVPLVQATLYKAYLRDLSLTDPSYDSIQHVVEGTAYAGTVLPIVHYCSSDGAEVIYDNLQISEENVHFQVVKKSFEQQYGCMGITCESVGGLWDAGTGDYLPRASPCNDSASSKKSTGPVVGVTVPLVVAAVFLLTLLILYRRRDRRDTSFTETNPDFHDSDFPDDGFVDIPVTRSLD